MKPRTCRRVVPAMRVTSLLVACLCLHRVLAANPVAFPGAEGFGAYAKGGRGGKVLFVTNLLDHAKGEAPIPGSLRAAVETTESRTIIFRVSGVIALKAPLVISRPFITIAGQTAPGDGICLKDYELQISSTHDVILRHLRIRPGENMHDEIDALTVSASDNIIVDHCSTSWSTDEVFSPEGRNITVQWCMVSEGLDRSFHPKGKHSKGSIIRGFDAGITFHHNLYAHNADRNPKMESIPDLPGLLLDFRNNVIYDWGYQSGYSGKDYERLNYVANFLKPGHSSSQGVRFAFRPGSDRTKIFISGNEFAGDPRATANNDLLIKWDGQLNQVLVSEPFPAPHMTTQPVAEARRLVLAQAGATLPRRDAIDQRLARDVEQGTGKIIDSQDDVGGWPVLNSMPAPQDSDNDGMPDDWEIAHGLNPLQADNNGDLDRDGYTNLEEFLNGTDPQKADASGDYAEYAAVLKRVAELNAKSIPQIATVSKEEKRVEAERKPLDIVVKLAPPPGPTVKKLAVEIAGASPMPLVLIPAGKFMMGSPETELFRKEDETQHAVTITKPFYMAVYTVTVQQFAAAMKIPGKDSNVPQTAPWNEAVWFCKNLSHATGRKFRLPTEAEWEYVCRAGTTTPFSTGETISTDQANFNGHRIYGPGQKGIYRDHLTPPGTFPPNPWGVCDMHGNFYQWCSDWIAPYPKGDQVDPQGPRTGKRRAMRGGNFSSHPAYLRSAARYDYDPKVDYGFRIVMEAETPTPK
ncbi:MAG: SUMF1/EgtB/PvdO family nonheme iron enzyme [Verrucomicrobiota bacterium]|nr:SUMF1/EgtB/PvdO family nonheme iron enzyme [Limisphaerales bacterium]